MLNRLFGRGRQEEAANALYGAIVAQARQPEFYRAGGVQDTVDGRFDLLALHVFLVLHRLRADGAPSAALGQALFDRMFADMDQSLREMGVGDLSVGRKVRAMAQALMGRIAAYEPGLDDPAQLAAALERNLYRGKPVEAAARDRVARYVAAAARTLVGQATAALAQGQIAFPEFDAP